MADFEVVWAVRGFVEQGGDVLLAIAFVTALMWTLIIERYIYFRMVYPMDSQAIIKGWRARADRSSWFAQQIRRGLISQVRQILENRLWLIRTAVALCPMFGLLGTVTGMIEVFDVMATGSGNARGMAAGVSKATLPTMAGMVAAISGMLFNVQLERRADSESERVASHLVIGGET